MAINRRIINNSRDAENLPQTAATGARIAAGGKNYGIQPVALGVGKNATAGGNTASGGNSNANTGSQIQKTEVTNGENVNTRTIQIDPQPTVVVEPTAVNTDAREAKDSKPSVLVQPFTYGDFSYGDFSYADYAESDVVKKAHNLLQQQIANKPGAYQSQWQSQINDYMSQIQNRDPFSYDFNSDALYQQYKDNYIQQGQMAMMDAMGQASAMTGGYGNSYAQTVGQQMYNQQLSQLNNVMPELHQMAYDRYNQEGQSLIDQYNMLLDRENQDYGRYQEDLSNWYNQLEYLTDRYDSEREYDYSKWETGRDLAYDQYVSDRNLAYDAWATDRDLAYEQYVANTSGAAYAGFDHVASSSDADIISSLLTYQRKGDDASIASYIDLLEKSGRIDEETANYLYETYRVPTQSPDNVDTTVDPLEQMKKNGKYASGGGSGSNKYQLANSKELFV